MLRYALIAWALATGGASADENTFALDFSGGEGKSRLKSGPAVALDKRKPAEIGPLLTAAPGDLLTLDVGGTTTFTGKRLQALADTVEETRRTEKKWGIFKKTIITRRPIEESMNDPFALTVGKDFHVQLVITPLRDGKPVKLAVPTNGKLEYRVPVAAKVAVELRYDTASVVFAKRRANADELKQVINPWVESLNGLPNRKEARLREGTDETTPGDVEKLSLTVKVKRPE